MDCSKSNTDSEIGLNHIIQSWFQSGSNPQFVLFKPFSLVWSEYPNNLHNFDPRSLVDSGWISSTQCDVN